MAEISQAVSVPTATQPQPQVPLKPHRGGVVLALGILGLIVCSACGIIAWVMGKNDLREMDAGIMDPAGRGTTRAGKICGIISFVIQCVVAVILLLILIGIVLGSNYRRLQ